MARGFKVCKQGAVLRLSRENDQRLLVFQRMGDQGMHFLRPAPVVEGKEKKDVIRPAQGLSHGPGPAPKHEGQDKEILDQALQYDQVIHGWVLAVGLMRAFAESMPEWNSVFSTNPLIRPPAIA